MNKLTIIIPLVALAFGTSVFASGSSPLRPPRPPVEEIGGVETLDNNRYALGKAVFHGKTRRVSNPADTRQQKARLGQLARGIGKEGAALPALAGQLSDEQMDALDYYVAKRFGVQ